MDNIKATPEQLKHQEKIKQKNANWFKDLKKQDKDHNNQITLYEIQLLKAISLLQPHQNLRNLLIGISQQRNIHMDILKLVLTQLIDKEYIIITEDLTENDPEDQIKHKVTKSGKALVKRINKKGE